MYVSVRLKLPYQQHCQSEGRVGFRSCRTILRLPFLDNYLFCEAPCVKAKMKSDVDDDALPKLIATLPLLDEFCFASSGLSASPVGKKFDTDLDASTEFEV